MHIGCQYLLLVRILQMVCVVCDHAVLQIERCDRPHILNGFRGGLGEKEILHENKQFTILNAQCRTKWNEHAIKNSNCEVTHACHAILSVWNAKQHIKSTQIYFGYCLFGYLPSLNSVRITSFYSRPFKGMIFLLLRINRNSISSKFPTKKKMQLIHRFLHSLWSLCVPHT